MAMMMAMTRVMMLRYLLYRQNNEERYYWSLLVPGFSDFALL